MGEIRTFDESHIPDVAALELKIFHGKRRPAGFALQKYFHRIFFGNPWRDDELPSLVYIHNGKITGFVGVIPRHMLFRGRPVRVAVASQFMVDQEECRGFAGLELIRRLFSGPQDLSLTDGATEAAHTVWTAAGARAVQLYSLEWTRLLRPLRYFRGLVPPRLNGSALGAVARLSLPACAMGDAVLSRLPLRALRAPETEYRSEPADAAAVLGSIEEIGWRDALRPRYDAESFAWLLAEAATARRHGVLRTAVVRDRGGTRAGCYVYYANPGGVSTALHVAAGARHFDGVFQALLRDAWEGGAAALRGQSIPRRLLNLSRQNCAFRYIGNGVLVHSKAPELVASILAGDAALTRLDGEWWLRFAVEDWD